MVAQEITPDKRPLIGLVQLAYEAKACLPNFQRDFVWPREGVADLLRSVLRGYYIGSLLLLRCDPANPPFAPVALRGAHPPHRDPRPDLLILDGQQRLTSMLYALTAPRLGLKDSARPRRFFIDLDLLLTDPDDDGIIIDLADNEMDGLDESSEQYRRRMLPCSALLKPDHFLKWRDGIDDFLRDTDRDLHHRFRDEWRGPWTAAVTGFQNFLVPLMELPQIAQSDSAAIGRVCAIFEKLNSTGVELSVYDLLTARLYRHSIKLHDLWKEAVHEHSRLAKWSEGKADTNKLGVLVLRTLSLMRGLDPKPRILINLEPKNFEQDWRRAAVAMERALELIEHVGPDGFGVFNKKWLPGFGLIPVLAAIRAEIEDSNLGDKERADLRRWYWCNVFMERYSSAVESKSRKDYAEMLAYWKDGKVEPSVFTEAKARIGAAGYTIRSSASYASALYSGVFCMLAIRNARDWKLGESIRLHKLNDHHIFPKAYLKRHGLTKASLVNSLVNRTLISNKTNNRIKDRSPEDYLTHLDLLASPHETTFSPHFMTLQCIMEMRAAGDDTGSPDVLAAYERYCTEREQTIIGEIRHLCGVS